MAPRTGQSGAGITPLRAVCGDPGTLCHQTLGPEDFALERELLHRVARAHAGKLGGFQEKCLGEFVTESFRWTAYMSRPGTHVSICENISSQNPPSFAATAVSPSQ
jgi:hypothetical protein